MTDKRLIFSLVLLIVGIFLLLNPRLAVPSSLSWSGDFWHSPWGLRIISTYLIGFALFMGGVIGCVFFGFERSGHRP
jgi:hypothetical protein